MAFQAPTTIAKALERIDRRDYALPAIQREFVWSTDQIVRLFDSLLRGYPIGSFLFWKVEKPNSIAYVFYEFMTNYHQKNAKHLKKLNFGDGREVIAILDGQQRLTALNIGLKGSYAEKLPRKWVDNASAYPTKYLYLNVSGAAPENDLGMEYDFRFLTHERAKSQTRDGEHWFYVPTIMTMDGAPDIFQYCQKHELVSGYSQAFLMLNNLHKIVHVSPLINFFEEESQDLDKVLNIFIRVNSGGTTLSYSDLLLSIATAQWKTVDARDAIHGLVDELNETGMHFSFSKDLILKSGLMLTDTTSIAFRVTNFNAENMAKLEENWGAISGALRIAVSLLSDFGFSERTLTADSVVIPIAYYIQFRHLNESYLTSKQSRADRECIRNWVVRSLVKSGVWGSGLDTLLLALRTAIQDYGREGFPTSAIEQAMARLGKSLRFDEDEIQDLATLKYSDRRTFSLLSLLYPGMNFRNEFHVDHIFPRSRFRKRYLKDTELSLQDSGRLAELGEQLPNLQLIEGAINVSKQDQLPTQWMSEHFTDASARNSYCTRHDLASMPTGIDGFETFFYERRSRIVAKLQALLLLTGVTAEETQI